MLNFFKNLKIGVKIAILVLSVELVSVLIITWFAYMSSHSIIESKYKEKVEDIAKLKVQKIENYFLKLKSNIDFARKVQAVKDRCTQNIKQALVPLNDTTQTVIDTVKVNTTSFDTKELKNTIEDMMETFELENIYILDGTSKANILFKATNTNKKQVLNREFDFMNDDYRVIVRDSVSFGKVVNIVKEDLRTKNIMYISAPIQDGSTILGTLVFEVNMEYVSDLVNNDNPILGKTGEVLLYMRKDKVAYYLNQPKNNLSKKPLETATVLEGNNRQYQAIRSVFNKNTPHGVSKLPDYVGNKTLTAWQYIPSLDWGLNVKVNESAITKPSWELALWLLGIGTIVIILSMFIAIIFSFRFIREPILSLRFTINDLSKGILPGTLRKDSNDEIGEMTGQLNELVDNLKNTAQFARKIGEGDYETKFKPVTEQDTLGTALITMRDSIRDAAQKDEERNWVVTGLAQMGQVLREQSDLEALGDDIISFVTERIGAVQGAFYVVNQETSKNPIIEMKSCYAYNKKKYEQKTFKFKEGLVGQAAVEQDTIMRTEVPQDYVTITSGILGDRKPSAILITPLITNEIVYGVLELAGFQIFGSKEISFIEEISEIIARTIFNIKVKENTEKLLSETREREKELEENREVLEQNAAIMEATQNELQKRSNELEDKVQEVQRANDRTRLLLENASEVITIHEENKEIRYISPSVEKILGYTYEEMQGLKFFQYIHSAGRHAFEQMFEELIDAPEKKITIQFSYKPKFSDESIWLEATGTNLLSDPAIQGVLVNIRDITERRQAEQEMRLRGQMQALSENSPDLIVRFGKNGEIFYINSTVENYTGRNKEEFEGKHLKDLVEYDLDQKIINTWEKLLGEVLENDAKRTEDVDFVSAMGKRSTNVTAIPEYNEQNIIESTLLVAHDITERKLIEMEIQTKNKKITESINYAKRIQVAILPDTKFIKSFFPESFILYKPKDVVSGDFPWFMEKGESAYIAAVDCTGHGVPGALISLIGYFLLNNIVDVDHNKTPAKVLDELDAQVTKTLKQTEGKASAQDGMDLALCRINKLTNEIQFAGAHRPMYAMKDGEFTEVKGNRFPIGSAQYKNKGNFTNHIVNYKQGDSIYIFSDGFPDQFGGEENNKKFSPRRIRDIIKKGYQMDSSQLYFVFNEEFEGWRGSNKQTDDVLMIGIKF